MGGCCTKSAVEGDPPVRKDHRHQHQEHHQVDEGLRAKQRAKQLQQQQQQQGILTASQKHHQLYQQQHQQHHQGNHQGHHQGIQIHHQQHQNGGIPGNHRSRDQPPVQSHRRPKSATPSPIPSVEHVKAPDVPKRPNAHAERKKPTARVGSNIKDNKETVPLGKRTNFGYPRDFKQKYTLGKLLGHGQFGYTYVAIEKATGERMAVKTIEKKQMTLPISVEDVKREVKILRTLSGHENVVQFYASFEDDDLVFIVMELCEGGELLDRILAKKDSRYSEKDAARIVRQMLNVAAQCHLNGVVHRDMKPENFLFKSPKEDSPLKATDFGLSDYIKAGKRFQDVVGSAYYVAPEVLKRKSGPESDVWSIGVITYILLCGRRPFWDKTEQGIFNEVLKKKPDFREKPWPTISLSAKDFVKKLLVKDAAVRLTAAQALSHPWAKEGGDASDIPLDISVLSNMREFVKYSRLKQLALRALASTLDNSDIADLRDQFNAIDIDRNGTITLEEMRDALQKDRPWTIRESRIVEILQAMDSNCDGIVDFDEFVAATLHVHQLEESDSDKWQKRSKAAFSKFDFDGDGYITADELKIATGLKGSMETLLDEADTDGDGRISLPEFQKLLRQASLGSRNNNDSPRPVVNARRRQEAPTPAS